MIIGVQPPQPTVPGEPAGGYRIYVLLVLLVVYTFNFIDRIVLGILVAPVKLELNLTDTELGFLGGTAFALFYTALGVPIGWLADRRSRVGILTVALGCWSAFTAFSGMAHSFGQLFLARLGVGIGEAGGVAPAYSLVTDFFRPSERSRALGLYSMGIPIGSALGVFLGGYIAVTVGWRATFYALGMVGLLLVPLVAMTVREPVRGRFDAPVAPGPPPAPRAVWRQLARRPSFWFLSIGAASGSIMGYGLLFWLPSFFQRSYGLSLLQVSQYLGAVIFVGGMIGIAVGGLLADRFGPTQRSAYGMIPAVSFLLILPCYLLGLSLPPRPISFLFFTIPAALQLIWPGPVITAIQHIVPSNMRAIASAAFLFIVNLLGIGLGSLLLGRASDLLAAKFGNDSLRYAILGGTGFYVLAAALFLLAARRLARDWADAT